MNQYDIIIIGGSAAGLTAAITARRHYPSKSILLIRAEESVPIPCGIPYIFGTVGEVGKNLIPDGVYEKKNIGLQIETVKTIALETQQVTTDANTYGYERLVMATGSLPAMPPIPGINLDGVYPIYKDTVFLDRMLNELKAAKNVAIIGGGFIGIEFADEINKSSDKNVTIIEIAPHCLNLSYDDEFCVQMETKIRERGVHIKTATQVTAIEGDGKVQSLTLSDGSTLPVDAVILGAGARPNVKLATEAGLRTGQTGALIVDRTMKTSDDHVFACGDCAEKWAFFGGRPSPLKLASIATLESRIAGANLFGIKRENSGTIGVWSTAIDGLAMATAGLTEKEAKASGYDVIAVTIESANRHPGGMPGMAKERLKLIFEARSALLLGGQVSGDVAAGEIINIISACIQNRMTAEHIAMFQLGTHPALTASPIASPLVNAAEEAISQIFNRKKDE